MVILLLKKIRFATDGQRNEYVETYLTDFCIVMLASEYILALIIFIGSNCETFSQFSSP
jgi:hypothetical protein